MKDKAIQGLSEANTKNRLANDAEVAKRNKENVGRRNDYKSGLSKVSTSSATPFFGATKSNVSKSLTVNGDNRNLEAKKRLNAINKGLQTIIPAANAAAKAAKTAKATKIIEEAKKKNAAKQKKGGFLKRMLGGLGGNDEKPSDAEQEEALRADAAGEEYEEGQAAGSVTIKLDKKTKIVLTAIFSGIFSSVILTCIFVTSAITTSGGEAYLATKDNPTMDELEQQYNAQDPDSISAESSEEAYLEYENTTVEFVSKKYGYNPKDLSDYFGKKQACTNDGSENDCRNGDEYKFYLKMYDMYYLYKNKYNVNLDLPLIMATLYYNDVELPVVFSKNLNEYDRIAVKDTNQITNLDWEYDYKNIPGYQYLDSDNSCYDMQILAKNMVTKNITYTCSDGTKKETKDIESSNYSDNTLKCDSGTYDKNTVNATYKLDLEKYDEFLLEYIKLKYYTSGSGAKYQDGDYVSGVSFLNGGFGKIHYYNQGDYSNYSYGSYGTIASHGCGPTSLSIVISSFLNEEHDPVEVTNYVCSIGGCSDDGTYHSAIADTAKHYGLKVNKTGDTQEVINALSSGNSLVIAIMCPGHFTTSGHFITLTGSTSEGKVTVADPGNRNNNKDWDFNIVAEETCEASGAPYWIISK